MTKIQMLTAMKGGAAPLALGLALLSGPAFAQSSTPVTPQGAAQQPGAGPAVGTENTASANGATQDQLPAAAAATGDIVVTGSRIPQPNLTSVSPVTVVNQQDFKLQGVTRAEDLLNTLPQVFADQGGNVSNGSTGTSTVNLRNLGAKRTLVLINGRRLVPGDPTDSAADVNFIPTALVKRVDVLTGGASSTYGADAVGGVVNFVMDTDFSGFKVDGQYSFYQHDNHIGQSVRGALNRSNNGFPDGSVADGGAIDTTAIVGAGFDDNRGHVVAYAGYRKINPVVQSRRDYSSCSLAANAVGALSCSGSATSALGNVIAYARGSATDTVTNDDGIPVISPFANGTSTFFQLGNNRLSPGTTRYNFGPTNYYQRPDERYTAGFFAHYDVADAFKPYLEGMFMDDRSIAQIAPSGDFGNTFSINSDNPFLSAQQRSVLFAPGNLVVPTRDPVTGATSYPSFSDRPNTVTQDAQNGFFGSQPVNFVDPATGTTYQRGFAQILKRNVEGGPRRDDLQHTDFRLVFGAKGDLSKAFSYDAYYQYGRTNFAETYRNDFSISRLRNALDVVNVNGVPTCRSVTNGTDPNCVPYNIFQPNGVTPEAVNYLSTPGFQRGQVTEQVFDANVTGLLGEYGIKSPFADDGVGINIGFEYRKEALNLDTDVEFSTGDLSGQGAATLPINGSFNVKEGFTELRVPLVQNRFVYDLSIEGGYRYSSYDVANRSFSTNTYKGGVDFAPIRAIRFRGAYNRSVRSPNIQEFFAPQRVVLDGTNDPCAGITITAANAGCIAQGLKVGQTTPANPAAQYNGLIGGNPNLNPEKADTYTAGVVLQPDFVPFLRGLAITVDYFNIKVKQIVQGIGEDTILATCTANAASPFCGLINRDSSGSLWLTPQGFVTDLTQNIGSVRTSGIDVGGSYAHDIGGLGSLSANFNGTWLDKFKTDNGVSAPYDCAGLYGTQCGTPLPEWRHKARVSFTLPDGIGLSGQWRYFGPVHVDASSNQTTLAGSFSPYNARISSQSYFDLTATATVGEHYQFRLGVNNILDRNPPLVPSSALSAVFGNGNTYPQVYDALGRYVYAAATLNF